MKTLKRGLFFLFISLVNFILIANQVKGNYVNDIENIFANKGLKNKAGTESYVNKNENSTLKGNKLDLQLSQDEDKKLGDILKKIRKSLFGYMSERGLSLNKESQQKVLQHVVHQKEVKEKKPVIQNMPFKWGK
jgi:hypothetical protein